MFRFIFPVAFCGPVTNHEETLYGSGANFTLLLNADVVLMSQIATCMLTDDVQSLDTPVFEAVKECVV
jgi:hypothetical protein